MGKWDWVKGQKTTRQETTKEVVSGSYGLNDLVRAGLIGPRRAANFRAQTGLADLAWRVCWSKEAFKWNRYGDAMRRARGFVVFMHGWGGSHAIWEQIPALVCAANPRLVALVPDVNGFGGSPFASHLPTVENCDPAANMAVVERWVDLLKLRSVPAGDASLAHNYPGRPFDERRVAVLCERNLATARTRSPA